VDKAQFIALHVFEGDFPANADGCPINEDHILTMLILDHRVAAERQQFSF